jgi:hypothetical protein
MISKTKLKEVIDILCLPFNLRQERAMDMWEDASEDYCSSNEIIEFFVSADGELEVTRRNALDFEILGSVL